MIGMGKKAVTVSTSSGSDGKRDASEKKLFKLFSKTRKIRQAIVKAGQDIDSPNFGRKN